MWVMFSCNLVDLYKVCGPYVVTLLDRTSMLYSSGIWQGLVLVNIWTPKMKRVRMKLDNCELTIDL